MCVKLCVWWCLEEGIWDPTGCVEPEVKGRSMTHVPNLRNICDMRQVESNYSPLPFILTITHVTQSRDMSNGH